MDNYDLEFNILYSINLEIFFSDSIPDAPRLTFN